jgi:DNA modification methylase
VSELPINQIICGDNVTVMETFPDASIDLVVTSPPYDNLRTYGGRANALKSIVEGFRASSENNFGNRDANGQDWLRDLLDKVADAIEGEGK